MKHWKFLIFSWTCLLWVNKFPFVLKAEEHVKQLKDLTFSWTPLICIFRFDFLWKVNKHIEHLKDFSIGWIISLVILNCRSRSNFTSRLSTHYSCCNIKMFKNKILNKCFRANFIILLVCLSLQGGSLSNKISNKVLSFV